MRTEFLCISVLRVASGPRMKLVSCKSALTPTLVYSTDRSKAVVPVLGLLFVALWFILRGDLFYVLPCVNLFLCVFFFSPFSTAITSLGEEIANLSAFRTFVRFALVWFCLFPLPLCVWEGLRFTIVALPGVFSYLFYTLSRHKIQVQIDLVSTHRRPESFTTEGSKAVALVYNILCVVLWLLAVGIFVCFVLLVNLLC